VRDKSTKPIPHAPVTPHPPGWAPVDVERVYTRLAQAARDAALVAASYGPAKRIDEIELQNKMITAARQRVFDAARRPRDDGQERLRAWKLYSAHRRKRCARYADMLLQYRWYDRTRAHHPAWKESA